MSTDADTRLGPEALDAVWRIFSGGTVDAIRLNIRLTLEGLDQESLDSYLAYATQWKISKALEQIPERIKALSTKSFYQRDQPIQEISFANPIDIAGASSAFSAEIYKRSGGYRMLAAQEDTELGFSIAEAGGIIKDVSEEHPEAVIFTQPRISKRTRIGFGRSIDSWNPKHGPFSSRRIIRPEVNTAIDTFLRALEGSEGDSGLERKTKEDFYSICKENDITEEISEKLWNNTINGFMYRITVSILILDT